jgi:hypothetical protein
LATRQVRIFEKQKLIVCLEVMPLEVKLRGYQKFFRCTHGDNKNDNGIAECGPPTNKCRDRALDSSSKGFGAVAWDFS